VTAASGYSATGLHAGIKLRKPDLALLVSDRPAVVAATFTRNRIQGATVRLCRERLAGGTARAVVVNSGNANACVGPRGMADARRMGRVTAEALGIDESEVFVCSTGTIGIPLPMDAVVEGIGAAAPAVSPEGGQAAAEAIMTTDTVPKTAAVAFEVDGRNVRVGGMAKGAGMIEPDMATMLAFLTTDAAVEAGALQACLARAVNVSFNRISVDGDQSCNDTVLLLANGAAGNTALNADHPDWEVFAWAVEQVCLDLAHQIVRDGEGATKFVTVTVQGAASDADATRAARQVANSLLVKTSWYGEDPNWGRVIDAVGHSGAEVREESVEIFYGDVCAFRNGRATGRLKELEQAMKADAFSVTVDLKAGACRDVVYTCDCSEEYVRINSEYMT
jgi:glutamate N-acetyltransferase/amino-acid N-acetyltransferase